MKITSSRWSIILPNLLPIWLVSIAIMAEGFPRPPISIELATASFISAVGASIALMWKRWMPVELFLYNLTPFVLLYTFDEITTVYKTPFILICCLILTFGSIIYQYSRPSTLRWLVLLSVAMVTLLSASHAANSFWTMAGDLGYRECFPDYTGCAPLSNQARLWWSIFFSF
jgi:hypothetical protein